jgi:hypothetical protein
MEGQMELGLAREIPTPDPSTHILALGNRSLGVNVSPLLNKDKDRDGSQTRDDVNRT